jgi:transposase, IS5 family
MRKGYSTQLRLDSLPIEQVPLNLECRSRVVPILRALQQVYSKAEVTDRIMQLIEADVNRDTRKDCGRKGMDYWHIMVLASVRLGCNFTYDHLHDLAENHGRLRAIMGIGAWDSETNFTWRTIRNNICLLKPSTIDSISHIIVAEGHSVVPEAVEQMRADSFVMQTNIHYPTESSLIRDGVRKIIQMCLERMPDHLLAGWRQHAFLWKSVRKLAREIDRIAAKKGTGYVERLKKPYRELIEKTQLIIAKARQMCVDFLLPQATASDVFGPNTLQAFIARTERVIDSTNRRVLLGESVPNNDKLFSMFEPHTQLYRRGKAGEPIQFGRQVLVFEDAAGFIVHGKLMNRRDCDSGVAVAETKVVQRRFNNRIKRLSFDRGFHSPANQTLLSEIIPCLCLPKPGVKQALKQMAAADDDFLEAQQNHPGVESAIGALQSGNGMERSRDRSEIGFERYISLAILGRNLQTFGRLLIAKESPESEAAFSRRKVA